MMEIVLSAAASPRLSQDSSVAAHKEQCLQPQPKSHRKILGIVFFFWSSCQNVCGMVFVRWKSFTEVDQPKEKLVHTFVLRGTLTKSIVNVQHHIDHMNSYACTLFCFSISVGFSPQHHNKIHKA